jgi:hypothetical protein
MTSETLPQLPNGAGSAAILAAGLASFMMAVLAIIADHASTFKKLMIFYTPTGPLSGVTTTAIAIWLLSWVALDIAWKRRNVSPVIVPVGLCLLAIGFVIMFPPVGDLF